MLVGSGMSVPALCHPLPGHHLAGDIHYHRSSLKFTLLSLELRALREALALLQRENEALLASHAQSSHAAMAREQQAQRDILALVQSRARLQVDAAQLVHTNQRLRGELEEVRASTATLRGEHGQLQEAQGWLEAEWSNLTEACVQLLAENVRLSEGRALQAQQHAILERETSRLRRTLTQLGHLPAVERHCPRTELGTEERVCTPCLRGWKLFSTHCYFFSAELRIWSSSRMHCLQQGGDLVVIDSMEEQEYLHRQTPPKPGVSVLGRAER
ncbi:C-type lectin domain family 4 member M-like isoform X2 [Alosa sapidissima]|uniref:C-type lectin domain family 4 member M-like isoform X2 n=1 Tax=Alosa sapidissima TaxID=34773 RepID=UPI001C0A1D31|nr:C-type lectin domain family 4 member M-like isoform X2 [Alosa sapidissima]